MVYTTYVMSPSMEHKSIVNPKGDMPVGVSDFARLVQDDYCFVDKTLLIKELLDSGDKVTLITRPRRFGKTINLDMLCKFFRDPPGGEKDLFAGLAISRTGDKYLQERGKRPVLSLTLKDIKEPSWEAAFENLRNLLASLVAEISKDAPVDQLLEPEQRALAKVTSEKALPHECKKTLLILTKLLALKHNGMTPWVILDEYDTPMQAAYQYNYYSPMKDLIRGLLGTSLKDNPYLHRAVITGIVRIVREDIFSGLNNPGIFGVLDNPFAPLVWVLRKGSARIIRKARFVRSF